MEEYPLKIHKFQQNGYNIVLDVKPWGTVILFK